MYAPTKTWRRWHRKVNVGQKRYAVVSALAASALPALVMARGHRIEGVPEVPLVVSDAAESLTKTKAAVELLKKVGWAAWEGRTAGERLKGLVWLQHGRDSMAATRLAAELLWTCRCNSPVCTAGQCGCYWKRCGRTASSGERDATSLR